MKQECGKVYFVGAGPGDPGLLTLKGKECLERADVVLYDYLANPVLLEHAPGGAERIYVGRRGRGSYRDQREINRLLIGRAQSGKIVVRLKGGDPFVFGRGGEEAEAVANAGIDFEIVPGVTAAVAVPAYAGIPVTHRTLASTVTFVTGHEDPIKETTAMEWPKLATANGTLVFLMGMKNLPKIVASLLAEGKSPETPAAAIRWGTRTTQQTIVGTLRDIAEKAAAAQLEPPTVIVVGEVVRLRTQLNWFEKRPLFGKRILVTRPRGQAAELSNLIAAYGGEPIECPTIQIVPTDDWTELDGALDKLSQYQWLIFTSANGIGPFMERLYAKKRDARSLAGLRTCCIGPRTAQKLQEYGLTADLVPAEYQAEGVINAMGGIEIQGQQVLIPRAAVAREILPQQLRALGAEVHVVPVYRTVLPAVDRQRLMDRLEQRQIEVVSFTSSSTAQNFAQLFKTAADMQRLMQGVVIACIGPITAETVKDMRLSVHILPKTNTIPDLAQAIARHYSSSAKEFPVGAATT